MNTARSSATSASRKIHSIAIDLRHFGAATLAALIVGCATLPQPSPSLPRPQAVVPEAAKAAFRRVAFADIPGWADDMLSEAWPAFASGCRALVGQPATAAIWRRVCAAGSAVDTREPSGVRAFFERHFTPYQVLAPDGSDVGLVTGYYEPLLNGSRTPSTVYRYPLYAPPDDLLTIELNDLFPELKDKRVRGRLEGKRVVPYWSRADIDAGKAALAGKALVYIDDAIEAFFVQIEGSGRVRLAGGGTMRLGYADQNGQPYRSIGRLLVERGELSLEQASMQGIKQWGRQHPDRLPALLAENPSYVFFRELVPDPEAVVDGPLGTLGVPLLARRTIAVDPRYIPLGAPVFLATTSPVSMQPLNRLTLAQDTGGAIRGVPRADFFWGFGDDAAREAGRMRQNGRMWLLWPKGAQLPP